MMINKPTDQSASKSLQVALLALPDAVISTLAGIYDVMNGVSLIEPARPGVNPPFQVEIVGERTGELSLASGVPIKVQRAIKDVTTCDIVIVPSVLLKSSGWEKGRYPILLEWLRRMHEGGAKLCSACSGVFLLAETGLYNGREATVHFGYADTFATLYPEVVIHPERVLVISGHRGELVSSGASITWHDMVLYLIAHHAGSAMALGVARLFALQWHQDGLAPYIVFEGKNDHGDGEIQSAQTWLGSHFSVCNPVEEMVKRSKLAGRTFKRRFAAATGLTPIGYVQRLRIEEAKRRLELTETPVEKISWNVGYEDAAFFRRLFKRITGMAPGAYRKRFRIPDFAHL